MNRKLKAGLTLMTAGALAFSSVAAFADTTTFANRGYGSILDLMLKDGVVTQTQIDSYQEKAEANGLATLKTNIQALVTDGTLTQAKADAVYNAVVKEREERAAKRTNATTSTATEKATAPEKRSTALSALVDAGTLTTAEYEAVQKVVGGGRGDMKGGRGMKGEKPAEAPATTTTAQ